MAVTAKEKPDLGAWKRVIDRLPITIRPVFHQKLAQWDLLFPFEQNEFRRFLEGIDAYGPSELAELTAPLRKLEAEMDVPQWHFSEMSDTMENASELARSAYYPQWRGEVQRFTNAIEARAKDTSAADMRQGKLLLLILPRELPLSDEIAWGRWRNRGRQLHISGDIEGIYDHVLSGIDRHDGVFGDLARNGEIDSSSIWFIDAGTRLDSISPPDSSTISSLSYFALKSFRDTFLAALNTMPKNIIAADETMASLRRMDWTRSFPPQFASQERLQSFVIDVFLSGNGALIFSNAFVEWAASEALRRARPQMIAARFGLRSKPKPFTSIAIFENQDKVSPLPDLDDPTNSAVDAAILGFYIWLASNRFSEYDHAVCLCISESLNSAWMIAPQGSKVDQLADRCSSGELCSAINQWLDT